MKTTSSPAGRDVELTGYPIRMAEMLATMEGAGFVARRSLHNPANIRKSKKAIRLAFETQQRGLGFSIVELLSSCPTNWKVTPIEALKFIGEQMVPVFPGHPFRRSGAGLRCHGQWLRGYLDSFLRARNAWWYCELHSDHC
jgi:2-oxoglutarate ferredoxin oxidoreductase subunit beta